MAVHYLWILNKWILFNILWDVKVGENAPVSVPAEFTSVNSELIR